MQCIHLNQSSLNLHDIWQIDRVTECTYRLLLRYNLEPLFTSSLFPKPFKDLKFEVRTRKLNPKFCSANFNANPNILSVHPIVTTQLFQHQSRVSKIGQVPEKQHPDLRKLHTFPFGRNQKPRLILHRHHMANQGVVMIEEKQSASSLLVVAQKPLSSLDDSLCNKWTHAWLNARSLTWKVAHLLQNFALCFWILCRLCLDKKGKQNFP